MDINNERTKSYVRTWTWVLIRSHDIMDSINEDLNSKQPQGYFPISKSTHLAHQTSCVILNHVKMSSNVVDTSRLRGVSFNYDTEIRP